MATNEIVRIKQVGQMCSNLVVAFRIVSFGGRILDCTVHTLNLAIIPRMVWLDQPILDAVGFADHVEPHGPGVDCVAIARLLGELNTVVHQDRVDAAKDGSLKTLKELPHCLAIGLLSIHVWKA